MLHASSIKEWDEWKQAKALMVIETGFLRGCQWAHQDLKQHLALHVKRGPNSNLSDWKPQLQNMNHPCTHSWDLKGYTLASTAGWFPSALPNPSLHALLARCAFTIANFKAPEAPNLLPPFFLFLFSSSFLILVTFCCSSKSLDSCGYFANSCVHICTLHAGFFSSSVNRFNIWMKNLMTFVCHF